MRTPFGARNWEYVSGEEPVLGGLMGAAYAQGVHAQNVVTQAKHFADNHQELDRMGATVKVDVATQMEVVPKCYRLFLLKRTRSPHHG